MSRDKLKLTQSHLCIIYLQLECYVFVSSLFTKQIFVPSVQGFENFCFIAVGAFHYLALEEDGRLLAQPLIMSQLKNNCTSIMSREN